MTTTSTTFTVRDINNACARSQLYVKLLTRNNGATAREMLEAAGAFTCHNSWSLGRFAETYGFECYFGKPANSDFMVYQLVDKGDVPSAFDDMRPV